MSLERISTGEPPSWAVAAVEAVQSDLAQEAAQVSLKLDSWLEDSSRAWVSTGISEDGEALTLVQSVFMAEASVYDTSRDADGVYIIEIMF